MTIPISSPPRLLFAKCRISITPAHVLCSQQLSRNLVARSGIGRLGHDLDREVAGHAVMSRSTRGVDAEVRVGPLLRNGPGLIDGVAGRKDCGLYNDSAIRIDQLEAMSRIPDC